MIKLRNTIDEYIFVKMIDDEDMNNRIVNRIDTIGDETYHMTNVKADCTLGKLHYQYEEFRKLADITEDFCKESSGKIQFEFENHIGRYKNPIWYETAIASQYCNVMWGTRATSEQVTIPHDHWPSTWAFCYYIDPPEGCPNLNFPTLDYELEIEHGMLVIFRGHLMHESKSLPFEGDRYCVAGTVVFNPPQTQS